MCTEWTRSGRDLANEARKTPQPADSISQEETAEQRAEAVRSLTVDLGKIWLGLRPLDGPEWNRLEKHLKTTGHDPQSLKTPKEQEALRRWGDSTVTAERVSKLLSRSFHVTNALEEWESDGIWTVTCDEPEYPQALLRELGPNTPPVLYGSGEKTLLNATRGTLPKNATEPTIHSEDDESDSYTLNETLDTGEPAIEILGHSSVRDKTLSLGRRTHITSTQLAIVSTMSPNTLGRPTRDPAGVPPADKLAKAWRAGRTRECAIGIAD